MSHEGHTRFHETLRETRVEKLYRALEEQERPVVTLPRNEDEDYWREREDQDKELHQHYQENDRYRNL